MADIFHSFPINARIDKVFHAVSTPAGFDVWWSKSSDGSPLLNSIYNFSFGPEYNWSAVVTKYTANKEFELQLIDADYDWINTTVGFVLTEKGRATDVQFYHTGWPKNNEHFRISSFCWAMYLRILKRYLEFGEEVAYEKRLAV
jgi:uncharacterized protein YndB with AHSA1/START domain